MCSNSRCSHLPISPSLLYQLIAIKVTREMQYDNNKSSFLHTVILIEACCENSICVCPSDVCCVLYRNQRHNVEKVVLDLSMIWLPWLTWKSSIVANRKSTVCFPVNYRWSVYVTPNSPNGGSKTEFVVSVIKIQVQWNKVCYKVSLCENFQRHSCSRTIPLSNDV